MSAYKYAIKLSRSGLDGLSDHQASRDAALHKKIELTLTKLNNLQSMSIRQQPSWTPS